MVREKQAGALSGWLVLALLVVGVLPGAVAWLVAAIGAGSPAGVIGAALLLVAGIVAFLGFTVVNPNEAQVVLLAGDYLGSLKRPGFWWVSPFTQRKGVSLRVRNFESAKLKVNDLDGNPIEIAAVVVWRVVETAEAMFQVHSYEDFVHVQSEAALRNLASGYAYDAHEEGQPSLRGHTTEIAGRLQAEVQQRLAQAGVQVIEARISHLAYAPEIASAMLQRQQASAIIAARAKIVAGAVGMVEMALAELSEKHVVDLDPERRAAMVSNLLVVLCSDRHLQPVLNTGTLYP